MRELDVQCIADKIAQLCVEANHYLGEDIKACIRQKAEEETWQPEAWKKSQKN